MRDGISMKEHLEEFDKLLNYLQNLDEIIPELHKVESCESLARRVQLLGDNTRWKRYFRLQ